MGGSEFGVAGSNGGKVTPAHKHFGVQTYDDMTSRNRNSLPLGVMMGAGILQMASIASEAEVANRNAQLRF